MKVSDNGNRARVNLCLELMEIFSLAQCLGYLAFILGVTAFLQGTDRRLKLFSASQCLVYSAHFLLLGNLPASASTLVSSTRSLLSLKRRSLWLAALFIVVNLAAGAALAKTPAGWLPIVSSCAATVAMFGMRGIPMRLVLLGCTLLWLVNNILSGSIGGTSLEIVIAVANGTTIARMLRTGAKRRLVQVEAMASSELDG